MGVPAVKELRNAVVMRINAAVEAPFAAKLPLAKVTSCYLVPSVPLRIRALFAPQRGCYCFLRHDLHTWPLKADKEDNHAW